MRNGLLDFPLSKEKEKETVERGKKKKKKTNCLCRIRKNEGQELLCYYTNSGVCSAMYATLYASGKEEGGLLKQ